MTHYTVDYASLSGSRKRWKALLDTRQYLGKERFDLLRTNLRSNKYEINNEETARIVLSFVGIQGYPAIALFETYVPH